ncbi:hypothetical protein [Sulfitobacter sp. EhC04]|jgi:hypothetical protein|uniref:hypothetical protein n=1 Tax=Sulfitobacter sp. EhC04 TaxID=1849168 RepID=UPI003FCC60FA
MTAAFRTPSSFEPVSSSHVKHGDKALKNLARTGRDQAEASRKWFAALLWRAFPTHSEADLALRAARVLDVSPRQVTNWLRCNNDASLRYVMAVMAIAGAEVVFDKIEGRR